MSVDRAPRSMHQNPPANAGAVRDAGSISALGRPPGIGNGNPLQYSCLQNPMERSLAAIVRGVTKSRTPLSMRALNANEEHFDLMDEPILDVVAGPRLATGTPGQGGGAGQVCKLRQAQGGHQS